MKDFRASRGPECGTDRSTVKRKIVCPMRKTSKEDKYELDMEIKIQSPKYKLHLFLDESIK